MSSTAGRHGQDHSELVYLHALGTLPSRDVPAVDAQILACAECRQELETIRPIIDTFVSWPTDVLRPPASLWGRLAQRLRLDTGAGPTSRTPPGAAEPHWTEAAPGISTALLSTDTEKNRVSMLVRLAPGADYPPHRHAGMEELFMLHGELIVDGTTFYPGDYRHAEPGSMDRRVWSETGCTCVLVTSFRDVFLEGGTVRRNGTSDE